jgi:hypothetical protein
MSTGTSFQGFIGKNNIISVTTSSLSVAVDTGSMHVRLCNSGTETCHVRVGKSPQTATYADLPVLSGESIVIMKGNSEDVVACICSSTTILHMQPGKIG